jgi:hypothetical protein
MPRRYRFRNKVPVIDIGLRLSDVERLSLQSEPVETKGDWDKRAKTLKMHGALPAEIEFLRDQRVELNAMTAPEFVAFLEGKLVENGVSKVVPDAKTVELHARRVVEQVLAEKAMLKMLAKIHKKAELVPLPENLMQRIRDTFQDSPAISWDTALANIVREACQEGNDGNDARTKGKSM